MRIRVITKERSEVEEECKLWGREILQTYMPDFVVFVANSGFLFGDAVSKQMGVPLEYVKAVRSGNETKDAFGSIAKLIPQSIVKLIISSPLKYHIHSKKKERNVVISEGTRNRIEAGAKKILLIDDAADTGWTIKQVLEKINESYADVQVKVASYTVSELSEKNVKIDFWRYRNQLVITATSRSSSEYEKYMADLKEWFSEHQ